MTVEADKPRLRFGVIELKLDGSDIYTAVRASDILLVRMRDGYNDVRVRFRDSDEWFEVQGMTYEQLTDIMRQS